MVLKPAIRNEHHEAYRAGRFDEIPEHILPLLEENYAKLPKTEVGQKVEKGKEKVKPDEGSSK